MTLRTLSALLSVAASFLAASTALAFSDAGACNIPVSQPLAGDIAANVPGFVISGNEFGTPAAVFVRVAADGTETAVDFTYGEGSAPPFLWYTVIPTAPLEVGAHYRIYPGECRLGRPGTNVPFNYLVGPAIPLPTTLGTLNFTPLQHSYDLDYYFDVTLTPSPEMSPWVWAYGGQFSAGDGRDFLGGGSLTGWKRVSVACPPTRAATWNVDPGDVDVVLTTTSYVGVEGPATSGTTHVDCASAIEVGTPDAGTGVTSGGGGTCSTSPGHATGAASSCAFLLGASLLATRRARRRRA